MLAILALVLFWAGALCALTWSWDRYLRRALAANIEIAEKHRAYKRSAILWGNVRSHTIGWSAFYFVFFLLLGLAGFPTWQRLGIGFLLALYYGYLRESRETGKYRNQLVLFSPRADRVWYFAVLSAEWFGYYGVLVFAGQLVVEAVK